MASSASRWWTAGAAVLAAATAGVGYSVLDDVMLFRKCSQAALEAAEQREDFTSLVGVPLAMGPWYTATLGVSHGGRSVSATFPVTGPKGQAVMHARALRMKGGRSTLLYNVFGEGKWHLFALQSKATYKEPSPSDEQEWRTKSIDLLAPLGTPALSPGAQPNSGVCLPCEAQVQSQAARLQQETKS